MDDSTLTTLSDALQAIVAVQGDVARLVTVHTYLLLVALVVMVVGVTIMVLQLRMVSADCKAIAAMTADVLRRTPER